MDKQTLADFALAGLLEEVRGLRDALRQLRADKRALELALQAAQIQAEDNADHYEEVLRLRQRNAKLEDVVDVAASMLREVQENG